MRKLHQSLDQQLDQLETERDQIAKAIIEVQRRIGILDEVMSWTFPEEEEPQELAQKEFSLDEDSQEEFSLGQLPTEAEFHDVDAEGTEIEWANR